MSEETESYKIPEVARYNLAEAREELYRGIPTTNYGTRERFKTEYQRI